MKAVMKVKQFLLTTALTSALVFAGSQALLMFVLAVMIWHSTGDWVYMAIWITGIVVLAIALIPAYRWHKFNQRLNTQEQTE